jgi:hypothetical protein
MHYAMQIHLGSLKPSSQKCQPYRSLHYRLFITLEIIWPEHFESLFLGEIQDLQETQNFDNSHLNETVPETEVQTNRNLRPIL